MYGVLPGHSGKESPQRGQDSSEKTRPTAGPCQLSLREPQADWGTGVRMQVRRMKGDSRTTGQEEDNSRTARTQGSGARPKTVASVLSQERTPTVNVVFPPSSPIPGPDECLTLIGEAASQRIPLGK